MAWQIWFACLIWLFGGGTSGFCSRNQHVEHRGLLGLQWLNGRHINIDIRSILLLDLLQHKELLIPILDLLVRLRYLHTQIRQQVLLHSLHCALILIGFLIPVESHLIDQFLLNLMCLRYLLCQLAHSLHFQEVDVFERLHPIHNILQAGIIQRLHLIVVPTLIRLRVVLLKDYYFHPVAILADLSVSAVTSGSPSQSLMGYGTI